MTLPVTIRTVGAEGGHYLVSNRKQEAFRCAVAQLPVTEGNELIVNDKLAEALKIANGDIVRIVPLT
jgi:arginine/ornithine N-succinyltransferase beta subunit